MTAQEYLAVKARMCDTYDYCMGCPFADDFGNGDCTQIEHDIPNIAEMMVNKWNTEYLKNKEEINND